MKSMGEIRETERRTANISDIGIWNQLSATWPLW